MGDIESFGLHLKKRNGIVDQNYSLIRLDTLLKYMERQNTVIHLDVKERAQRRNPLYGIDDNVTNACTAACDANRASRDSAFIVLLSEILLKVRSLNAFDHVTVKTTMSARKLFESAYNGPPSLTQMEVASVRNMLPKIHYYPVIQANTSVNNAVEFINEWYNSAPDIIIGFEANFKTLNDPMMQQFTRNGKTYQNILHYIAVETGLRAGLYTEEPMGPKGIVDRYAQWLFKDLSQDFRGDPFFLMNIPYYGTSIITTDRPDIWKQIGNIYNPQPQLLSAFVNEKTTKIENLSVKENSNITARYKSGSIMIDNLDKSDIGSNVAVYNMQGGLIYRNKITSEPQMIIPIDASTEIYILTISGNRSVGLKLFINH
jgi:hypothetical protein